MTEVDKQIYFQMTVDLVLTLRQLSIVGQDEWQQIYFRVWDKLWGPSTYVR